MAKEFDFIIVGGGIGGLSCAHFLRKAGMKVCILERNSGLTEVGAGLQLAPNALAALAELDLLQELLPLGWNMQKAALHSTRSGKLQTVDLVAMSQKFGTSTLAIHRATLQKILARDFSSDELRFGIQVESIQPQPNKIIVQLRGGEILQSRLLIGADGLHSQVRRQLFPPVSLRYSGTSSFRGITLANGLLAEAHVSTEIWGPGCRFGFSHINATEIYWYLTFDAPPNQILNPAARKELALRLMEHFPAQKSLVAETKLSHIIHTDIGDLEPNARWVQNRVALLGDAAHATTPNLGQGAAQAIEDSWALGLAVQRSGPIPEALQNYQRARESKALWIVQQSWNFQTLCHIKNPVMQILRDWAIRFTPAFVQQKALHRIFTPEVGMPAV